MNNILYGKYAKIVLMGGITKLAKAVKSTLGAGGKSVLIQEPYTGKPFITKDGVTVAKAVHSDDEFEMLGINIVREVALATNTKAGDGTTTSIVLAEALINRGLTLMEGENTNTVAFKKGMDLALRDIEACLKVASKPAKSLEALTDIGKVSTNGDEDLSKVVAEAVFSVGEYGSVKISPSKTSETYIEKKNGLVLNEGVVDPMFLPPNCSKVELEKPLLVITNHTLQSINDFGDSQESNGLNILIATKRPVVVFCENISTGFAQQLIEFVKTRNMQLYVVKCPDFGQERILTLGNMAALTGGKFFDAALDSSSLKTLTEQDAGQCDTITISNYETTLTTNYFEEEAVVVRQHFLESLKEDENYSSKVVEESIARLLGLSCIIHVGANSEIELKEKMDRVEDAVNAATSAYKEGVVAGGGVALANCNYLRAKEADAGLGYRCVIDILDQPFKTILSNAGIEQDYTGFEAGEGINVLTEERGDMINMGIVDPLITIKTAITNAVSIAGTLLTTDCVITQTPEKTTTNFI